MDRRTEYTRREIQTAFLTLMRQKDYVSISVSEICRAAGINRSTFYLHYHRIDDVLNAVIDEIIQNIDNIFEQLIPDNHICNRALCQFIRDSGKYQPVLLDETLGDYIIGKIGHHFLPEYVERICSQTRLQLDEANQVFWFQLHGCFAVAKHNLNCDDEKWAKIKCALDKFINRGLFGEL